MTAIAVSQILIGDTPRAAPPSEGANSPRFDKAFSDRERGDVLVKLRQAVVAGRHDPRTAEVEGPKVTEAPAPHRAAYEAMQRVCSDPQWLDQHGKCYTALESAKDFFAPPFKEVHALPEPGYVASNFKAGLHAAELYYVNGMRTTPRDMKQHLSKLVKTYGRPVTAIINDQEEEIPGTKQPGFFRSIFNGVCGFLSSDAGHLVEPGAVERLEQVITRHVRSGQKMQFMAHSQGSIIVRNALDRVLGEHSHLTDVEKARVRELVSVATFGAAEHYFPRGIRVQEYAHRNDPVALGTSLAADIREGFKGCVSWLKRAVGSFLFGTKAEPATPTSEQLERAPRVFLDGEHDFGPYISKLPHFFIEKYQSEGTCTGDGVAQALIQSIRQGRLSDVVHARIIKEMVDQGNRDFARVLLQASPSGTIEAFHVPCREELQRLVDH
jgi:hypothetical protein